MIDEKMTNEFRAVDEAGMLVRVIEYMTSGSVTEGSANGEGLVTYIYRTEEGEECAKTGEGDFIETSTGRKLERIRS